MNPRIHNTVMKMGVGGESGWAGRLRSCRPFSFRARVRLIPYLGFRLRLPRHSREFARRQSKTRPDDSGRGKPGGSRHVGGFGIEEIPGLFSGESTSRRRVYGPERR